ncbi:acyl-CoA dehydrogenase family protein [Curtobacterium flaccumfaciens]|nr:acyl-CoA dehydrogenase family protein [Curtobacterium flaccumfaciens]
MTMVMEPQTEADFQQLKAEVTEWVRGRGEEWAEEIERTGQVAPELFQELKDKGWLSLAAPAELGGRGIPFSRYLEIMEVVSRSHASIRMLVHVINGTWRAMQPYATPEQIEQVVKPSVAGTSSSRSRSPRPRPAPARTSAPRCVARATPT